MQSPPKAQAPIIAQAYGTAEIIADWRAVDRHLGVFRLTEGAGPETG